MYQEIRESVDINSVNKFCDEFLDRCECCGKIEYKVGLNATRLWHGQIKNVCWECKSVIERENEEMSGCVYDEIDAIVEAYRLGVL